MCWILFFVFFYFYSSFALLGNNAELSAPQVRRLEMAGGLFIRCEKQWTGWLVGI